MKDVLNRANAAIEKMKKEQEVQDLLARVDDWKGHRIEQFGHLITFGTHAVLKGDSGKDEREVRSASSAYRSLCGTVGTLHDFTANAAYRSALALFYGPVTVHGELCTSPETQSLLDRQ